MAETATLLITCPDQKGLVAAVSEFLFRHGANITHADQHVDQAQGLFLQRVEFELEAMDLSPDQLAPEFGAVADSFGMDWVIRMSADRPRAAILVSRQQHCLTDLLARHSMGELPMHLVAVVSNHEDARIHAEHADVPFHHLPVPAGGKEAQEASLAALVESSAVDLVILARYMQILSPSMVAAYPNRIINIHHSFLPAFPGARPYHQAHERGVKIIGATAHYVTDLLDQGPIIAQDVARVSHRDSVSEMTQKGRDLEKVVLAKAVRLHLESRVLVYGNRTVVFD
jgi:formyltetrahydrofolate deformylase